MKTTILITVFAVAAMVNVNAKGLPSINCIIQVKELAEQFESQTKKQALEKICQYYAYSQIDKSSLNVFTNTIAQTNKTLDIVFYTAQLAALDQVNTDIYKDIASAVANAESKNSVKLQNSEFSEKFAMQVKELASKAIEEKKVALNKICDYYVAGKINSKILNDYTNLIMQSNNNIDVLEHAALLAGKNSNASEVIFSIAQTAANSNVNSPAYISVLDYTLQSEVCSIK